MSRQFGIGDLFVLARDVITDQKIRNQFWSLHNRGTPTAMATTPMTLNLLHGDTLSPARAISRIKIQISRERKKVPNFFGLTVTSN